MAEKLEYQCPADKAWYAVSVDYGYRPYFTVKYEGVEEREEEEVNMQIAMKVKNARESFRLVSKQLQDYQCRQVIENMLVCALYQWNGAELYYDARVTEVNRNQHEPKTCDCTFKVRWVDGPGKGEISNLQVQHICLPTEGSTDARPEVRFLERFVEGFNRFKEGDISILTPGRGSVDPATAKQILRSLLQ